MYMYMRPLILWDFLMYYLIWGFLIHVQRFPNIMGLSYVQLEDSPLAPPTVHKRAP